jgi:hypothetical protein
LIYSPAATAEEAPILKLRIDRNPLSDSLVWQVMARKRKYPRRYRLDQLTGYLSIADRCALLRELEVRLKDPQFAVEMECESGCTSRYSCFVVYGPKHVCGCSKERSDRWKLSRPAVEALYRDMHVQLLRDAKKRGEIEIYASFWPLYSGAPLYPKPARQFHSTFDDCSSVWTHESNWKRRDDR